MPKVPAQTQEYYINVIRQMRARKPYLSIIEVRDALAAKGMVLTRQYVADLFKLGDDASLQAIKYENAYQMLAPVVERLSAIRDVLWGLIADKKTGKGVKVYAVKTLMDADKMMMEAIYNSGLLQKDLGKLEVDEFLHGHITHTHYEEVAKTMQNFGLLSPNQRKLLDAIILPTDDESEKAGKASKSGKKPKTVRLARKNNSKPTGKKVVRK